MYNRDKSGKIYLVGAGPGDPGLLTIKAYKALKDCDVVIYDALVNPGILAYVPPETERIFIGPSRHKSRITQREIERVMIEKAMQGYLVVRLKGGDPFVFGRGGEEAEAISEAGIKWEIIPGISAGIAVPAYAAIPLTHRDCASSVGFITGHQCLNKATIQWDKLRDALNTLVIFMGVCKFKEIIAKLLSCDYKPATPIAIIEAGTTPKQRIRTGTLGDVIDNITEDPIQTPALLVVGEVVKYREKLIKHLSLDKFEYDAIKELMESELS
jgi:uroporphyrin-III C-methyltransferase